MRNTERNAQQKQTNYADQHRILYLLSVYSFQYILILLFYVTYILFTNRLLHIICWNSFCQSPTQSLTCHSLSYSISQWRVDSASHSLSHSFTQLVSQSVTYSHFSSLTQSLYHAIHLSTQSVPFTYSYNYWCNHTSPAQFLPQLLAHLSFAHSLITSLVLQSLTTTTCHFFIPFSVTLRLFNHALCHAETFSWSHSTTVSPWDSLIISLVPQSLLTTICHSFTTYFATLRLVHCSLRHSETCSLFTLSCWCSLITPKSLIQCGIIFIFPFNRMQLY